MERINYTIEGPTKGKRTADFQKVREHDTNDQQGTDVIEAVISAFLCRLHGRSPLSNDKFSELFAKSQ